MSVYYKFKAELDFSTITFDGIQISVGEMKREIIEQRKLGKNMDFDLQIMDAQTREVFLDDGHLIPKNTSIVVQRIPLAEKRRNPGPGGSGGFPHRKPYHHHHYNQGEGPRGPPPATQLSAAAVAKGIDLTTMEGTEEDKIKMMMAQSTADYDPSNYQKVRMNQVGRVPEMYRCYKCQQPGHWIKNCPLNTRGGEMDHVKKSTGIPRSFMVTVEGPGVPGAMRTPEGRYAVPVVDRAAYMEKHKPEPPPPKPKIPNELLCSLCNDLLTDALLVPCCATSYCDECIRTILIESVEQECPGCHEKEVSPNSLIANRFLRNAVNTFKNDTGYIKLGKDAEVLAINAPPDMIILDGETKTETKPRISLDELPDDLFPHSPTRKVEGEEKKAPEPPEKAIKFESDVKPGPGGPQRSQGTPEHVQRAVGSGYHPSPSHPGPHGSPAYGPPGFGGHQGQPQGPQGPPPSHQGPPPGHGGFQGHPGQGPPMHHSPHYHPQGYPQGPPGPPPHSQYPQGPPPHMQGPGYQGQMGPRGGPLLQPPPMMVHGGTPPQGPPPHHQQGSPPHQQQPRRSPPLHQQPRGSPPGQSQSLREPPPPGYDRGTPPPGIERRNSQEYVPRGGPPPPSGYQNHPPPHMQGPPQHQGPPHMYLGPPGPGLGPPPYFGPPGGHQGPPFRPGGPGGPPPPGFIPRHRPPGDYDDRRDRDRRYESRDDRRRIGPPSRLDEDLPKGIIEDPVKEFERIMRERDRKKAELVERKRSRSPSPFDRPPLRRSYSRSRSPSPKRRRPPPLPTIIRRRRRSYSRSRSPSPRSPPPRRIYRSRSRSPLLPPPSQPHGIGAKRRSPLRRAPPLTFEGPPLSPPPRDLPPGPPGPPRDSREAPRESRDPFPLRESRDFRDREPRDRLPPPREFLPSTRRDKEEYYESRESRPRYHPSGGGYQGSKPYIHPRDRGEQRYEGYRGPPRGGERDRIPPGSEAGPGLATNASNIPPNEKDLTKLPPGTQEPLRGAPDPLPTPPIINPEPTTDLFPPGEGPPPSLFDLDIPKPADYKEDRSEPLEDHRTSSYQPPQQPYYKGGHPREPRELRDGRDRREMGVSSERRDPRDVREPLDRPSEPRIHSKERERGEYRSEFRERDPYPREGGFRERDRDRETLRERDRDREALRERERGSTRDREPKERDREVVRERERDRERDRSEGRDREREERLRTKEKRRRKSNEKEESGKKKEEKRKKHKKEHKRSKDEREERSSSRKRGVGAPGGPGGDEEVPGERPKAEEASPGLGSLGPTKHLDELIKQTVPCDSTVKSPERVVAHPPAGSGGSKGDDLNLVVTVREEKKVAAAPEDSKDAQETPKDTEKAPGVTQVKEVPEAPPEPTEPSKWLPIPAESPPAAPPPSKSPSPPLIPLSRWEKDDYELELHDKDEEKLSDPLIGLPPPSSTVTKVYSEVDLSSRSRPMSQVVVKRDREMVRSRSRSRSRSKGREGSKRDRKKSSDSRERKKEKKDRKKKREKEKKKDKKKKKKSKK